MFYAVIGIKRAYYLLGKNCGGPELIEKSIKGPYNYTFEVTQKINCGDGKYFECPNWYNKIYSK